MRLLLFINLIAIVVIAGALGRYYEGTPLPWKLSSWQALSAAPQSRPDAATPQTPDQRPELSETASVTPSPNPRRAAPKVLETPAAPARATLRILTEGAYPPFNYRNGEGELTGFDVDMAKALCTHLERECSIETRAWNELLPALKRGEADAVIASMLIPSHGRHIVDADIAFTQPYYTTPGHFAARRDARLAGASAEALAGRRIVVEKGSTHEAFLRARFPDSIILDVGSLAIAEASLANGRADLLFADRNALLRWTMNGEGEGCCRLVGGDYADPVYFGEGAGVAVRSEDETLLAEIDETLTRMKTDGTKKGIALRYFGQAIR